MTETIVRNQRFDQERALYGARQLHLESCRFDGPADGESALKECQSVRAADCFFNLRYPCWHDRDLTIENCEMTLLCRAALWYSDGIVINGSKLHGIKALRECGDVTMTGCDVSSEEFGWFTRGISMTDCTVQGAYFMFQSKNLHFSGVKLRGKYSLQYIENALLENCDLDTKDAFWHGKNITVRNSTVKGEYLGWYSENLTLENCTIIGTQPLCYCKDLKLVNCRMIGTDLCFEKSDVEATVTTAIDSIKNIHSGYVLTPEAGEMIWDDPEAKGVVLSPAQPAGEKAEAILAAGEYTCALCRGSEIHTSNTRGVKPLLQWLEAGTDLGGASAADKVVGKATAFLYCLLGVQEVYARVISQSALAVLETAHIRVRFDSLVPNIINRKGDGICPFEATTADISDPQAALGAIRRRAAEMDMS